MSLRQFKIIPLLVVVSMLAFSVRLVEVANGVSSLGGAAIAAENAPSQDELQEPGEGAIAPQTGEEQPTGSAGGQGEAANDDAMLDEMLDEEPRTAGGEWTDSGDSALEYSDVRQEMFEEISARREALDARERVLTTREALLRAAEQELERKYQELSAIRSDLEMLLDSQSEEEKKRLASLVKIYEGMKAKDAARIFDTLDLDVLVAVMGQMSERKLAPILAAMNAERARTITIMLAEQNQLPILP